MEFNFIKSQGCGNDFVIVDERKQPIVQEDYRGHLARVLCDRNFCIGATSVLYMLPPSTLEADVLMRIFEADRSESSMCGNGVRCIADCYSEKTDSTIIRVQTKAGIKKVEKSTIGPHKEYSVDMGNLATTQGEINKALSQEAIRLDKLKIDGRLENIPFERVSPSLSRYGTFFLYGAGEPHLVIFVDEDVYSERSTHTIREVGDAFNLKESDLRKSGVVPFGCNVNLAQRISQDAISIRTYERGVDNETLACGTGATACAAVAYLSQIVDSSRIQVSVKGKRVYADILGDTENPNQLTIGVNNTKEGKTTLTLIGPAEMIARGELVGSGLKGIEKFLVGK